MVLIEIEVLDAQLDYNIALWWSYMYAMLAIASFIFQTIMFPHEDRIFTVDQLTHSEKWPLTYTDVTLAYVDTYFKMHKWHQEYGTIQFKQSSILGSFLGDTRVILESSPDVTDALVCMMSSSSTEASQDMEMSINDTESLATSASLAYVTSQTPFLFPLAGFLS